MALSSRVNGLPFTIEQLNQVALMGPIYLPKHRLSHRLNGWEDGQTREREGEKESERERGEGGHCLTEKQMWTPESYRGVCKSNENISAEELL